jgi:hypothetical protein
LRFDIFLSLPRRELKICSKVNWSSICHHQPTKYRSAHLHPGGLLWGGCDGLAWACALVWACVLSLACCDLASACVMDTATLTTALGDLAAGTGFILAGKGSTFRVSRFFCYSNIIPFLSIKPFLQYKLWNISYLVCHLVFVTDLPSCSLFLFQIAISLLASWQNGNFVESWELFEYFGRGYKRMFILTIFFLKLEKLKNENRNWMVLR